ADGTLVRCAPSFEEALLVWEVAPAPTAPPPPEPPHDSVADLHAALILGIRDYFWKTGFFSGAVIGLSGGLDSAVTCALAVEALGAERVVGLTMPSRHSSSGSVDDSVDLAKQLGIELH